MEPVTGQGEDVAISGDRPEGRRIASQDRKNIVLSGKRGDNCGRGHFYEN